MSDDDSRRAAYEATWDAAQRHLADPERRARILRTLADMDTRPRAVVASDRDLEALVDSILSRRHGAA